MRLDQQEFVAPGSDLVYADTQKGVDLLPIRAQIGIWSRKYRSVSPELGATAAELEAGGPAYWKRSWAG